MEPDYEDDAHLVRRARAGDEVALRLLMARFTPRLRAIVSGYPLCEADRVDVVQEVWVRFWQKLHTIQAPARVAGWLRTAAHREALRRARSRERPEHGCLDEVLSSDWCCPETDLVRSDHARAVRSATRKLDARERDLAYAIAHEPGVSYAQLARRIGVTEASVGQLRARCLRRLRRLLTEEGIADLGP